MALIKCPECEQPISDKAFKCPRCGYPIREYLSSKTEETQTESVNDTSLNTEGLADTQQAVMQKGNKKKIVITLLAVCAVAVVLGIVFASGLFTQKLIVENITISKWRLTDSSNYGDYYEGTVTSEQKRPFIAVIGQYDDEESIPKFVYVENGKGVIETYEDTDEDPSIKYRTIGYMGGKSVELSDMMVQYKDSDYYDLAYSKSTSCNVLLNIDMNSTKNGLLVFDIVNETNNETKRNLIAPVINGTAEYNYYADLPYKARGVDISIAPRLFCESSAIAKKDYIVEKAYTAEKNEGEYYTSYSGGEMLAFADYPDGLVLYTMELKEGGNKEDRNVVKNSVVFLQDRECTLLTYDYGDKDETILMPKYEFNIIGYITWIPFDKETI